MVALLENELFFFFHFLNVGVINNKIGGNCFNLIVPYESNEKHKNNID